MGTDGGVDILTFHGDAARLGWNARETRLAPLRVTHRVFGKLWERRLDGQVYASPLHVSNLEVKGQRRDVVFAATQNNSVYALDAASGEVLWGARELAPSLDETQFNDCTNIHPRHGITGTPAIDRANETLYVCGITQPGIRQVYLVWALDIRTGAVRSGWPIALKGEYRGCRFDAGQLTQRGGLLLSGGWLYLSFGSRCDIGEWHGWIIGLDTRFPSAPLRAFTPSPTASGGGIWGSGGLSADARGDLYGVAANGPCDLPDGGENVCESVFRLMPRGAELSFSREPRDYYVPPDYRTLAAADTGLGGSSPVVLPDRPGLKTPRLLVVCGKDGLLYLLNREALGGVGGEVKRQRLFGSDARRYNSSIKATPAYFDAGLPSGPFLYVAGNETGPGGEAGVVALRIRADAAGAPTLERAWNLGRVLHQPGAPTVSSDGPRSGVVWVIETKKDDGDLGSATGTLYALDALTGQVLYTSDQNAARDALHDARKFSCPTVANGRVFVGTHGVVAYGLLGVDKRGATR